MAGNFFRGTTVEQDGRWGKSDKKLIVKMTKEGKFSRILDTKVDLRKVNIDIISKWITEKVTDILGFEDDVVINLVINLIASKDVDPKQLQLDVTGFLEKQAGAFVEELWILLLDAQQQPSGIPSVFIQKKKEEIMSRQSKFSAKDTLVVDSKIESNNETSSSRITNDSNLSQASTEVFHPDAIEVEVKAENTNDTTRLKSRTRTSSSDSDDDDDDDEPDRHHRKRRKEKSHRHHHRHETRDGYRDSEREKDKNKEHERRQRRKSSSRSRSRSGNGHSSRSRRS